MGKRWEKLRLYMNETYISKPREAVITSLLGSRLITDNVAELESSTYARTISPIVIAVITAISK